MGTRRKHQFEFEQDSKVYCASQCQLLSLATRRKHQWRTPFFRKKKNIFMFVVCKLVALGLVWVGR